MACNTPGEHAEAHTGPSPAPGEERHPQDAERDGCRNPGRRNRQDLGNARGTAVINQKSGSSTTSYVPLPCSSSVQRKLPDIPPMQGIVSGPKPANEPQACIV